MSEEELPEAPIWDHIIELAERLKRIFKAVIISAVILSVIPYKLNPYVPLISEFPRLLISHAVPEKISFMGRVYEVKLAQFSPFAGFNVLFQATILLGLLGASPVIAREIAGYLAPALYKKEKELLRRYSAAAIALFILGMIVAYFVVVPWSIKFLFITSIFVAGEGGLVAFADIERLFSLIVKLIIATGVMFEIPLVIYILIVYEVVDIDKFRGMGLRYAFIASLVLGAIISPDPTGMGMLMLAIPYFMLLFIAIKLAERSLRKRGRLPEQLREAEKAREEPIEEARLISVADATENPGEDSA